MSQPEIITAYRALYKQALRAVQYSKPARYAARDRLRTAFRTRPSSSFDQGQISRTLTFLEGATKAKGTEHKLVKNLLYVWHAQKFSQTGKLSQKAYRV